MKHYSTLWYLCLLHFNVFVFSPKFKFVEPWNALIFYVKKLYSDTYHKFHERRLELVATISFSLPNGFTRSVNIPPCLVFTCWAHAAMCNVHRYKINTILLLHIYNTTHTCAAVSFSAKFLSAFPIHSDREREYAKPKDIPYTAYRKQNP